MNKSWRRTLLMLLLMLAGTAGFALAEGPCTCDDVPALKARLVERTRLARIAAQVAAEAAEKWFPTTAWAEQRFRDLAFPNQKVKVLGKQDYGKPVEVSEEFKAANCDGVWKSVLAHEQDHAKFDKTIPNAHYPWIMIFGQEGGVVAPKEAMGYAAEVEYLTRELLRLEKECEKKKPDSQPSLERYQENDQARRAEQKERLARAAARVATYASAIK